MEWVRSQDWIADPFSLDHNTILIEVTAKCTSPTKVEVESLNDQEFREFLKSRNIGNEYVTNIIDKQKVNGKSFLSLNAETLERWEIPGGPAIEIENLIIEIQGGKRSFTGKVNIIVDNSNLLEQGRETMVKDSVKMKRLRINFEVLQALILNQRELDCSEIFCSYTSKSKNLDKFWAKLEYQNFVVHSIKQRSYTKREKKLDTTLVVRGMRILLRERAPGILAIVSGDADYVPLIHEALKEGWKVELWFWSLGFAEEYKKIVKFEKSLSVHYLDDELKDILYDATKRSL
ncbi:538_t:CDS:2 [Funneliformis geosporum]|uniref:538_t:CDS:1 n=1 Tax=Funneliformis geosporum TaxID=1117311 RepID=A0A9W4SQ59_9GLOM|nr:538_t:CDS:2 [Funneliformis geosporum]